MKKNVLMKTLIASLVLAGMSSAYAAGPNTAVINVSGKVTTQTCTIDSGDVNKAVALQAMGDTQLTGTSFVTIPVTFSIGISGCDPSLTKAAATIGGTTAVSTTAYTPVIANTGTATNVGIGFTGKTAVTSTPAGILPVGGLSAIATLAAVSPATTTSGKIYLGAAIVPLNTANPVVAGTVAGTATVTMTYS